MIETFNSTIEKMHQRYLKILEGYYPAHKSTGFTEANLTANLVKSLESVLGENAISWFEAPISAGINSKHIDAVVFDIERQTSFFIEAKRFSIVKSKTDSIKKDMVLSLQIFGLKPIRKWLFITIGQDQLTMKMRMLFYGTINCLLKH